MANIPALPNAGQLPVGQTPYGSVTALVSPTDARLIDREGNTLVTVDGDAITLNVEALTPATVPYVNRFVAHLGIVKRNWRTGSYDLKQAQTFAPARVVRQTVVVTDDEPDQEDTRTASVPAPSPVITVAPANVPETQGSIPGLEVLPKVKVRAISKGFVGVGDVVVPEADLRTLQDALALCAEGHPAAVMVTGPAGTAKTLLVRAFAASTGLPYLKVDGGSIRTADDWAGSFRQDPNTKTWAHRWSPFAQVLRAGKPAIIHIDEVSRTESPQALNALLGLLDLTGTLTVPDAATSLRLPPGILVIATANIGPEFVGTLPIDGAVRQRFPYGIRLGYAPERVEAKLVRDLTGCDDVLAASLVRMAVQQRLNRHDPQQYPSGSIISTRVIVDIARRVATCGRDPREAVLSTLAGQFDPEDDKALSVIVDTQFPPVIEAEDEAVTETTETPEEPTIVVGKHYFSDNGYGSCSFIGTTGLPCGNYRSDPSHF